MTTAKTPLDRTYKADPKLPGGGLDANGLDAYQRIWIPRVNDWVAYRTRPDVVRLTQQLREAFGDGDGWTPLLPLRCRGHDFGGSLALAVEDVTRGTGEGETPGVIVKTNVAGAEVVVTHTADRLQWKCRHYDHCGREIDWAPWEVIARYLGGAKESYGKQRPKRIIDTDATTPQFDAPWG